MTTERESFEARIDRIESLVDEVERTSDASARETTREIVRALLELHGAGLRKILELVAPSNGGGGRAVLEACLEDDLVRSLLLLHDLHPESLERRVRQALEKVRPYLESHGGNVELLEVAPAGIRLRMEGSCHGCPSSAATLRDTIERAICEVAPDVGAIEVEGLAADPAPAGLISLQLPASGNRSRSNGHLHALDQSNAKEK